MKLIARILVIIVSTAFLYFIDENLVFPVIFQNVPSPYNWVLVVVASVIELYALLLEAELLFKDWGRMG